MYDWLNNLLAIPSQYANTNVVYATVGTFLVLVCAFFALVLMMADRIGGVGKR